MEIDINKIQCDKCGRMFSVFSDQIHLVPSWTGFIHLCDDCLDGKEINCTCFAKENSHD